MAERNVMGEGRMLRSGKILMIREKAEGGKSAYAIGKELGISKNTAHKYIKRKEEAPVKNDRFSKLDAYKPLLHELMNQGIFKLRGSAGKAAARRIRRRNHNSQRVCTSVPTRESITGRTAV